MKQAPPGNQPNIQCHALVTAFSPAMGILVTILTGIRKNILPGLAALALFAVSTNHSVAGRVNIAKYQQVSASGQSGTYSADFAVDGIVSNFHSFRTNDTTNPQWLEVAYPRPVTIGSAHLYLGLDNDPARGGLTGFKFQYHNGSTWVDVPGSAVTGNTSAERSVIFSSAVTSDRFRLYTDEDGSRTIREMALFPPNLVGSVEQGFPIGKDVRLSLGHKRPTDASTIYNGNFAKRAVDGHVDDLSRWLCSGTGAGDTLEIDLLENHIVGSAHLYSGNGTSSNPAQNFVLDYWDGGAWQPIPGATFTTNSSLSLVIPFTTPVTTSKIRYRTTTGNYARVRELLLFPPRTGGYPLGQDVETGPPPTETWDRYSDSYYRLRNNGPDLRLGIVGGSVVNVAADANFPSRTEWQLLLNHRDGSYRVHNAETGLCLALAQISLADNTPVTAEEYSGLPHQDWNLSYVDATRFTLVNEYSGLTLEPAYGSWASGSTFVVRPASLGSNIQIWTPSLRRTYPKKGIAATHNTDPGKTVPWGTQTWMDNTYPLFSNTSWSYCWGRPSANSFPYLTFDHAFNPMQWGDYSWTHGSAQGPPENLHRELQSNPKPAHYLGFNEPDSASQGYITPANAVMRWPRLEARDTPLVAPVPATIAVNSSVSPAVPASGWMNDFVQQADALGYRRDYTAVHWYSSPDSSSLITYLEDVYQAYGRPVWLTEFSVVDWTGTGNSWTKAANYNFLAEFLWRAESLSWLKRYSLFQYVQGSGSGYDTAGAPRSNTRNTDGSLTAFGQLYAGWDGVTDVVNYRNYHLHNKQEYRRVRNPVSTDTISSVSPETSATGNQWILIPGTTANTVRIVSTLDGRRLRYYNGTGTYVGMAPAGNFTVQSEWTLVPDAYGWYFLEHPQTGIRLRMNASGTPVHGTGTGATDDYKWRFVAPAVTDNTNPSLDAIPDKTVNEGTLLTFTATATDTDLPADTLTYSLIGAPAGASINSSTGAFTWTPTEAQGPGIFNFTVSVSDGALTYDQPVAVTVNEVNVAPVLTAITAKTVNEGSLLTFTASATDADLPADTLTYSLIGAPAGASINSSTGAFTWTPTETQGPATYNITVSVSDGALTYDQPVAVTVNEVNVAPVLAAITAKTVNEGILLTFTATATDADLPANTLTYSLVGAPAGAAIHSSTGVFTWTPGAAQGPATYNFTVRADDGNLTNDKSVSVTVNNASFNSYITNPAYGIGANRLGFNDDPDGDGLTNGVEAFFGTHPGLSNPGPGTPATNRTTTTFTHPRNPYPAEDLNIAYEWSPDLSNWYAGNGTAGPADGTRVTTTSQTTNNITTVTATSNAPQTRIFLRAVVSQN